MRRRTRRRWPLLAALVVVLAAGGAIAWAVTRGATTSQAQPLATATVQRRTLTQTVDASFTLAKQDTRRLASPAAGTVTIASPEGGYGNYTCIDHGGGLSTCYGHQERFLVSAGQQVAQGQIIGLSDCTGYCFGPHVHFEVRINGQTTDPLGYL